MSVSIISIGGGYNAASSLVPVASKFNSSISASLQAYVNTLSAAITLSGSLGLEDNDVAKGVDYKFASAAATELYEITNTDSAGGVIAGPPLAGPYTVPAAATSFVAQEGGDYTVQGSKATSFAILGAYSNVDYSVVDPVQNGSIFAAGGSNNINIFWDGSGATNKENIYSAGNDSINLSGLGNDSVTAENGANDFVNILSGTATVSAEGNSTVQVLFSQNAGASLDFINNSTTAQTVFSGAYTLPGGGVAFAPNSVTAFGGAGGGYYVGGLAGNNSLIGGTGDVTMQGAGSGDVISVNGANNVVFSGTGVETILASSASGSNAIQIGGPYVGKGDVTTSGIASSDGSGLQSFIVGNVTGETITGSTVTGATNLYDVIGDSTAGGGSFTITDFTSKDTIFLTNGSLNALGDATITAIAPSLGNANNTTVVLSDGTTITLKGVAASTVDTVQFGAANGNLIAITTTTP